MANPFSLEGRVVIVTGASRGIGKGTAIAVSESGGHPVMVARTESDLREIAASLPGPSTVLVGDVADPTLPAAAVTAAEEAGGLWGLVNNAGITPYYHPATETTDEEWQHILQVNLRACAAFARESARRCRRGARVGAS